MHLAAHARNSVYLLRMRGSVVKIPVPPLDVTSRRKGVARAEAIAIIMALSKPVRIEGDGAGGMLRSLRCYVD